MSMSSARRSARLRRINSARGAQEQWGNLSGIWWDQYIDFTQHARRLSTCTQRCIIYKHMWKANAFNNKKNKLHKVES